MNKPEQFIYLCSIVNTKFGKGISSFLKSQKTSIWLGHFLYTNNILFFLTGVLKRVDAVFLFSWKNKKQFGSIV